MSKKFPEDVLAEILGIPSHNIGNVILTAGTNSQLFDYPEPQFATGALVLSLSFNIVAKDRELFKHIEESYILESNTFGSFRLIRWSIEAIRGGNWLVSCGATLLRGSETENIVRSFV